MKSAALKEFKILVALLIILLAMPMHSSALEEVGADSRIRTLIYGKNDVYRIITSFGYQTTIELEEDEKIKTMSLGNAGSFKITPQRNRMFIKTLQGGQLTNMVVITNKRTYQFELSSIIDTLDEIMYVVRFYYPDSFSDENSGLPSLGNFSARGNGAITVPEVNLGAGTPMMRQQQPQMPMMPQSMMPRMGGQFGGQMSGGVPMPSIQPQGGGIQQSLNFTPPNSMVFNSPASSSGALNYNYSLTGPDFLSPTEVFDDGVRTYLKFGASVGQPVIRFSQPIPVNFVKQGAYFVIDGVSPIITVYFGSENICIYNESMSGFR